MTILNADEREAMDAIVGVLHAVQRIGSDRLIANEDELVAAVHVLQGFVTQHALQRLDPENWSPWYTHMKEDPK